MKYCYSTKIVCLENLQISRNGKRTAILAVQLERNSKYKALSEEAGSGSKDKKKKKDKIYVIYRPNTGQQVNLFTHVKSSIILGDNSLDQSIFFPPKLMVTLHMRNIIKAIANTTFNSLF